MIDKEKIKLEAKRIEEDSLYSAKTHFCAGHRWASINLWVGGICVTLSAIAGASAFSEFDQHNIISGVLSIIVAGSTAVLTFINPNERAAIHQRAGTKYNSLRNDTRIFYDIGLENIEEDKILENLHRLNERRNKLNLESCQTPRWAFVKARKGIEEGEAKYEVDL